MSEKTTTEAATPKAEANGKPAKANPKAGGKGKGTAAANPKGSVMSFLKVGSPELKDVKFGKLTFDARLQHRSKLTDEATVEEYAEVDRENAKAGKPSVFPPLKVVHETKNAAGEAVDNWWVYDGFQRGAAFEYVKRDKVAVEVVGGTFEDAFFLSLSSNSTNSVLPRNKDDKRRSVMALVDAPETLEVVASKSDQFGGFTRAIAAACGVSVGTVDNALTDRGVMVRGKKLVARPKTAAEPTKGKAKAGGDDDGDAGGKGGETPAVALTPEQQKAANDAAFLAMQQTAFAERVTECMKMVKRLSTVMATLVTDGANKDAVRAAMARHKLSVSDEFDVRAKEQGDQFAPYYEILELWPIASKLGNFFAELKKVGEEAAADKK